MLGNDVVLRVITFVVASASIVPAASAQNSTHVEGADCGRYRYDAAHERPSPPARGRRPRHGRAGRGPGLRWAVDERRQNLPSNDKQRWPGLLLCERRPMPFHVLRQQKL